MRRRSARTQSSRFLSEVFGSGVQHIAFETDDIFATVAKLRANGVHAAAAFRKITTTTWKPGPG